jgi:hypothetical protein
MNAKEYRAKLEEAREANNIYLIARYVGMLSSCGEEADLSPNEYVALRQALEDERRDQSRIVPLPGYMVMRWHMLLQYFDIEAEVTQGDIEMARAAALQYLEEENFYQLASFKQTCDHIGVEFPLIFTEEEQQLIDKEMEELKQSA